MEGPGGGATPPGIRLTRQAMRPDALKGLPWGYLPGGVRRMKSSRRFLLQAASLWPGSTGLSLP